MCSLRGEVTHPPTPLLLRAQPEPQLALDVILEGVVPKNSFNLSRQNSYNLQFIWPLSDILLFIPTL